MISIRQGVNEPYEPMVDDELFWRDVVIFSPLVVGAQAEFDYLWSMQLMIGKAFDILLLDRDENHTGYPPSFVKIDIPL